MDEILASVLEHLDNVNFDNEEYQPEDVGFLESLLFDEPGLDSEFEPF